MKNILNILVSIDIEAKVYEVGCYCKRLRCVKTSEGSDY